MSKCPWYGYGPTNCGSPKCGGNIRYADWMCEGRQRNRETYRDCPFYVNKKDYARPTGRKCPQCIIQYGHNTYTATCISPKNPATNYGESQTINGVSYSICAEGRTEHGKRYTGCPYYTRRVTKQARERGAGATVEPSKQNGVDPMLIFVIVVVILALYGYVTQY